MQGPAIDFNLATAQSRLPKFAVAVIHDAKAARAGWHRLRTADRWGSKSIHVPAGRGPFKSREEAAIHALVGKDHRPGGELAEHARATVTIVAFADVSEFLADRRGIGVVSRGLRSHYAEVDRDQDRPEAIFGRDLVGLCQADQAAHFLTKIGTDVLLGEPGAELFIVRPGRIVNHVVPPNRLLENFALERREIVHAYERTETVFDVLQIVIVAAGAV